MRQTHLAGDKMFVDYSGKKPHVIDQLTGEVIEVELFVAVLCASSCTFAESTYTQQLPDWIASNMRARTFFGGVPNAIVPDPLKSAVTLACKYEPGVQRTFDEWARHYETTIFPARPREPLAIAAKSRRCSYALGSLDGSLLKRPLMLRGTRGLAR
jgi:transposase